MQITSFLCLLVQVQVEQEHAILQQRRLVHVQLVAAAVQEERLHQLQRRLAVLLARALGDERNMGGHNGLGGAHLLRRQGVAAVVEQGEEEGAGRVAGGAALVLRPVQEFRDGLQAGGETRGRSVPIGLEEKRAEGLFIRVILGLVEAESSEHHIAQRCNGGCRTLFRQLAIIDSFLAHLVLLSQNVQHRRDVIVRRLRCGAVRSREDHDTAKRLQNQRQLRS